MSTTASTSYTGGGWDTRILPSTTEVRDRNTQWAAQRLQSRGISIFEQESADAAKKGGILTKDRGDLQSPVPPFEPKQPGAGNAPTK